MVSKSLVSFYVLRFLSVNKRGRVRGGGHVSYPPPNRFMMAPVSILDGGAVERMGAEELNTSAGGGKVEIMFLDPKHAQIHTKHTHTQKLFIIMHSALLSSSVSVHAVHAGIRKEVSVIH